MRVLLPDQTPHRTRELRILIRDHPEHSLISRGGGAEPAVGFDVLRSEQEHDEFVDGRQVVHELPRILARAHSLLDEGVALVLGLRAEHFDAGAALGRVVLHHSLKRTRVIHRPGGIR